MGGAPLNPGIKRLIIRTWTELKDSGKQPTATSVRLAVAKLTRGKEAEYGKLPKLRTFQELLRNAKKTLGSNQFVDEQWTMTSLIDHELPPDSIPYVIKIWRYAANTDEKFSIIQAKWVSRLYHFWDDVTELWYYSRWYADIERTHILMSDIEPISTIGLDSDLFMTAWEATTLYFTRYYQNYRLPASIDRPFVSKNGKPVEELIHYKNTREDALWLYSPDFVERDNAKKINRLNGTLTELIKELPLLDEIGFNFDSKMIYLRLYTHMIKRSKWNSLTPKQAVSLIMDLRQWVLTEYKKVKNREYFISFDDIINDASPFPTEIFSKAGIDPYNIQEDEE